MTDFSIVKRPKSTRGHLTLPGEPKQFSGRVTFQRGHSKPHRLILLLIFALAVSFGSTFATSVDLYGKMAIGTETR